MTSSTLKTSAPAALPVMTACEYGKLTGGHRYRQTRHILIGHACPREGGYDVTLHFLPVQGRQTKVLLRAGERGTPATFGAGAPDRLVIAAESGGQLHLLGRAYLSANRAAYELALDAVPVSGQLTLLDEDADLAFTLNEESRPDENLDVTAGGHGDPGDPYAPF